MGGDAAVTITTGSLIQNGFLEVSGSTRLSGSVDVLNAVTASFFKGDGSALTGVSAFPFAGDAQITGSLKVFGQNSVSAPTTASLKIDSDGYFYHLGRYTGNSAAFGGNNSNVVIGNDISTDGDYGWVVIGDEALASDSKNSGVVIGRQAQGNSTAGITIGVLSKVYDNYGISLGTNAGNHSDTKGINIGGYAKGKGAKNIVLSSLGSVEVAPTKANAFGIYMTNASPNFEIEATGSSRLSGSSFTIEKSGSTLFEVIGSEGTIFSLDDDLDGTLFTVNDRSGIPQFEVSSSGLVEVGDGPLKLKGNNIQDESFTWFMA
jgi:hypothetical protein